MGYHVASYSLDTIHRMPPYGVPISRYVSRPTEITRSFHRWTLVALGSGWIPSTCIGLHSSEVTLVKGCCCNWWTNSSVDPSVADLERVMQRRGILPRTVCLQRFRRYVAFRDAASRVFEATYSLSVFMHLRCMRFLAWSRRRLSRDGAAERMWKKRFATGGGRMRCWDVKPLVSHGGGTCWER